MCLIQRCHSPSTTMLECNRPKTCAKAYTLFALPRQWDAIVLSAFSCPAALFSCNGADRTHSPVFIHLQRSHNSIRPCVNSSSSAGTHIQLNPQTFLLTVGARQQHAWVPACSLLSKRRVNRPDFFLSFCVCICLNY